MGGGVLLSNAQYMLPVYRRGPSVRLTRADAAAVGKGQRFSLTLCGWLARMVVHVTRYGTALPTPHAFVQSEGRGMPFPLPESRNSVIRQSSSSQARSPQTSFSCQVKASLVSHSEKSLGVARQA